MKYTFALAPLSALALAACGDAPADDAPKSVDEVAEAAAGLDKPLPGEYTSNMELTEISIPGQPQSVTDQMKGMMGGQFSATSTSCVTQEQIDKGFKDRFLGMGEDMQGSDCNFDEFTVDGSELNAKLACTAPGGVSTNIAMVGNIEPERQTIDMSMDMRGAQIPGGEMSMKMKVVSERTGDCG